MVTFLKRHKFILFGTLCLAGLLSFTRVFTPKSSDANLIIYSYGSFSSSWGPGPILKKMFEEKCQCNLQIRDAEDSRLLLQRLEMEGKRIGADVVVGLNQWDVDEAVDKLGFRPTLIQNQTYPEELKSSLTSIGSLVPFDWGILAFNTKSNTEVVAAKNLKDLLATLPDHSLALQDPRTSAPGLSFLFWLVQVMGEDGAFAYLEQLNKKIFTIASGWSSSYGLFQKGQAKAVFSYITSPLYHQIEEKDSNYLALSFDEGLPIHIEFAGVLSTCTHCSRAEDFVHFLASPEAQVVLMKKNYMLPIDMTVVKDTPWDIVKKYKVLTFNRINLADKKRILERWTRWVRER